MTTKEKATTNESQHIPGMYLVLTTLIGLIGGYLVKSCGSNEYCKAGGLWTSADKEIYCNIFEKKDSFNIQINGLGALTGKGYFKGKIGKFTGKEFDDRDKENHVLYQGEVSLQGCDNLSISFWDTKRKGEVITLSFIRAKQESPNLNGDK
jgi:hypothetical protein